ncbi:hypothetical protein [Sphingomonas cynarae]|uniref:hypothetical protein n=1 Tax=Sphingomonas cynarae TaxID=930197 RepID=UPI0031E0A657
MKHEPGIFDERDNEAGAASLAHARADVAAGRVHDQAITGEWLAARRGGVQTTTISYSSSLLA